MNQRFQLRHAAGLYWLLDMEQKGPEYVKPIAMNEAGAYIWSMLEEKTQDEIVQDLCQKYEISEDEARKDVGDFLKQLDHRIMIR